MLDRTQYQTLSGVTISDQAGANASSGALAANYTLTGGTHSFAINQKAVNISGTRQYNGTTNIAASDISGITGTVNTETLTMSSGLGSTSSAKDRRNLQSNRYICRNTCSW